MRRCGAACVAILVLLGMWATSVLAGGGQASGRGAEGALCGIAPPPGFTFANYMYYYEAGDLKDNKGNDTPVFDHVSAVAEILRFVWISDLKIFGADYGQHFFLPIINSNLHFKVPLGPRSKKHYSDTNIPYFIYAPALFAWHTCGGKLHFATAPDIFIPLYNEQGDNLASVGRNFWTIEPAFAVTWLPMKRLELSAKFMYDFNSEQQNFPHPSGLEFDRRPGQEFHFDYNCSYVIFDGFRFGAGGFFYTQVTDDDYELSGITGPARTALKSAENDFSRVWAIGPDISYQHANIFFELKSQFEMGARNMSEGFNTWFKFCYVF
ncbi:MAG: transporter [Syntrophobacteraceae bacterium]